MSALDQLFDAMADRLHILVFALPTLLFAAVALGAGIAIITLV